MGYRNKTYVAFASEDIKQYYLMEAWRENTNIEFSFYDAHDLFISIDTSQPETIKRNLRERMKNAKQVILLGSSNGYRKGSNGSSFLAHELKVLQEFRLPVVIANLDGDRTVDRRFIPQPLLDNNYYTVSTSFQPKIIQYALDNYASEFAMSANEGPHQYPASTYTNLGL
ncbi:TIR domain-containing protein [Glutamicibacter halophytocola]|uniref:TIR domain-containing protein n=1 Tax=Glutamicibacter halophytocola TaxID=1933880 RepID=UPI0015C529DD|nr:TIR domain-containing protein [Glutamicibacter halophytocola]NQD41637.1 molecular chaperone Tir [Glutamicibacter halophytocola]